MAVIHLVDLQVGTVGDTAAVVVINVECLFSSGFTRDQPVRELHSAVEVLWLGKGVFWLPSVNTQIQSHVLHRAFALWSIQVQPSLCLCVRSLISVESQRLGHSLESDKMSLFCTENKGKNATNMQGTVFKKVFRTCYVNKKQTITKTNNKQKRHAECMCTYCLWLIHPHRFPDGGKNPVFLPFWFGWEFMRDVSADC